MSITLTTELDAVNAMLATIGETPVTNLATPENPDATLARNILLEVSRDVQSQGWSFNTEDEVTLPAVGGIVSVASNVLSVYIPPNTKYAPVQRGSQMYDAMNHTSTFPENLQHATVVYALDFELLPEPARRFILMKAACLFQDRVFGSEAVHAFTSQEITRALVQLKRWEYRTAWPNLRTNPEFLEMLGR